jgi:hypothetical protein
MYKDKENAVLTPEQKKSLSEKRIYFFGLLLILVNSALIIWEIVDLFIG